MAAHGPYAVPSGHRASGTPRPIACASRRHRVDLKILRSRRVRLRHSSKRPAAVTSFRRQRTTLSKNKNIPKSTEPAKGGEANRHNNADVNAHRQVGTPAAALVPCCSRASAAGGGRRAAVAFRKTVASPQSARPPAPQSMARPALRHPPAPHAPPG